MDIFSMDSQELDKKLLHKREEDRVGQEREAEKRA